MFNDFISKIHDQLVPTTGDEFLNWLTFFVVPEEIFFGDILPDTKGLVGSFMVRQHSLCPADNMKKCRNLMHPYLNGLVS